jgi:hypothetical protein
VLQDVGGIDLVEVIVGEGPGILVQVTELVAPVIHGIEIHPALADIEAAADIQATGVGSGRCVHEWGLEEVQGLAGSFSAGEAGWDRDFRSKAQFQDRNSRTMGMCSRNQNSG